MIDPTTFVFTALLQAQVSTLNLSPNALQDSGPLLSKQDSAYMRRVYGRAIDLSQSHRAYPPHSKFESAVFVHQTTRILKEGRETFQPLSFLDYAFLEQQTQFTNNQMSEMGMNPQEALSIIRASYKGRFGYTRTPEVTNTPDHHWSKISLDNLYRNQFLVGDPTP